MSRRERAADPLPRMVYAKHADPPPWHIVKAQESMREAATRSEINKALTDASDKIKQRKLQTLERLREVRETATQIAAQLIEEQKTLVGHPSTTDTTGHIDRADY